MLLVLVGVVLALKEVLVKDYLVQWVRMVKPAPATARCFTLRQLAQDATFNGEPTPIAYGSGLSENSTAWDADFIQHCKCYEPGYGNNSWYNLSGVNRV